MVMVSPGSFQSPRDQSMPRKNAETTTVASLIETHDYLNWFNGIAEETSRTKSAILRIALAEWAERSGHSAPPSKRNVGVKP